LAEQVAVVRSVCWCAPGGSGNEEGGGLQKYLWIGLGGALGALSRYWVGAAVTDRLGAKFPYGTLIINVTACVIIGFSLAFLGRRVDVNPAWRYLIPVGFVGAYSTFSTYEWDTISLMRGGAFWAAAIYSVGSLVLGLAAVWVGIALGERVA
jgi:CrcB protein